MTSKENYVQNAIRGLVIAYTVVAASLAAGSCTPSENQTSAQKGPLFAYKDSTGTARVVNNLPDWDNKREQILRSMEDVMGRLPDRSRLPAFNAKFSDSLKGPGYTRYSITLTVAEGEFLPAYFYVPVRNDREAKFPAIVALHPTGDKGKKLVDGDNPLPNRSYARELAGRGYVVIAPDYPSMGDLLDYDFASDRYESGTMKAIFNHMRCVDFLQSLKYIDPERIGVIGHSLGGNNAMFLGAFDTRLKVIVSSCGWTLFDYYDIGEEGSKKYGGRLGPWAQDRYMPLMRERYQLDAEKIPFDFDDVIAAIAPRAFFSNSPLNDSNFDVNGVREGIKSAAQVYRFFGAENNLVVRYPQAEHDFPDDIRQEAYRFIDAILKPVSTQHEDK